MTDHDVFQAYSPQMKVSIIVATFGDEDWHFRGIETAVETWLEQNAEPEVVRVHGETLAQARNEGARLSTRPWLVFLDADDRLEPNFTHWLSKENPACSIVQTSVQGFNDDGFIERLPVFHTPKRPLSQQNFLIIGSPIRREVFEKVGGFDEWPVLEDWALFLKCQKAGAKIGQLRECIYYINDNHDRNQAADIDEIARKIRETYR